jgi:hypothetical protein
MPTVTPINNWPIPEDTDLVKDGAKAIRDLGNAIDTSSADFAGGLVHINTTAFSATAAVNFNNVFSSTYDNYKVLFTMSTASGNNDIKFRMRAAGSDDSTSNYSTQRSNAENTAMSANRVETNGNIATIAGFAGAGYRFIVIEIQNPFLATPTTVLAQDSTRGVGLTVTSAFHNVSTSYDGISFIVGTAANMTGTATVFGYRK